MWRCHIERIDRIWECFPTLLPRCAFTLSDGTVSKQVSGWLPCHHANLDFVVEVRGKNIRNIVDITVRQPTPDVEPILSAQKRFRKFNIVHFDSYGKLATKAYHSLALRTVAVAYPFYTIRDIDVEVAYAHISANPCILCDQESPWANRSLLYNATKARDTVQRVANIAQHSVDWNDFDARMAWQIQLRWDTGTRRKPPLRSGIQKYKGLWTTNDEITRTRQLEAAFKPCHTNLTLGSPCPSHVPTDAVVVCLQAEDVFRWHCCVEWGTLHVLDNCPVLTGITVYVAFAHQWSVEQWCALASKLDQCRVVCIGRLDQYPRGRGQVFRDMWTSGRFTVTPVYHHATDNVAMIQSNDVQNFVKTLLQRHAGWPMQCFADEPRNWASIDTGRIWMRGRVRTVRHTGHGDTLYEEKSAKPSGTNASVMRASEYRGIPVPYVVYICSEATRPFDVHVARTHARRLLYVINCQTCLFSFERRAPERQSINPFLEKV